MKSLYLTSNQPDAGKSAVALALALESKQGGCNIGYFKPVGGAGVPMDGGLVDEDALLFRDALDLDAPLPAISPIILTPDLVERALGQGYDAASHIRTAFEQASSGREAVLIEGAAALEDGLVLGASARDVAELTESRALLVVKLTSMQVVDKILQAGNVLGDRLAGVIFISVPRSKRESLEELLIPYLSTRGLATLGILPRDKTLSSVTVGYLREALHGEILCAHDRTDLLVETFLVGAMGQENALRFFWRKANKAVITGGDRADLQTAALETPTRCLILTGNLEPSPAVLGRAEVLGIPIILVPHDTMTTTEMVEAAIRKIRLDEPQKVERMQQLLRDHADLPRLGELIGCNLRGARV